MKYNSFEEMKSAVSDEIVGEESKSKWHENWMKWVEQLRTASQQEKYSKQTKSDESEEELWDAQREETSISGGV